MQKSSSRAVAYWVLIGVVMLVIQVILGGITRLTGSGLSITEWNIVTGALPPLNQQQWITEFEKYKLTPQYHLLNTGFELSDFKFIFFWEWFHRLWARLVGVVFIVGFVYLLWKKELKREMIKPLIILFLLGALQGAVGWIMVASGLTGDAIYVRPTRLALHFIFAMGLVCYAFWFALQLSIPRKEISYNKPIRGYTWSIIFVLFFQLLYGALMAGHKAAAVAPTWPSINGDIIPSSLFKETPLRLNFIDNTITIHFIHRLLAYIILVLIGIWSVKAYRLRSDSRYLIKGRWMPIFFVVLQIALGIAAVLSSPGIVANRWVFFDWVAQLHQLTGMLLLLTMIYMLYLVRPVLRKV
ncbi:MAG: COX15/CtaA family protein [Bacteroidetes bacterium]|nr:COX15/CtaA family protein [Bacteroidota bacterium]